MKVACFTVATMDYFPQQRRHFPGGNALNQAVRFSDLGLESAFIGAVGTDSAGDTIQSLFEKRHVDTSHMYRLPGATANNQLVNDESGERFGVEGTWTGGVYDEFTMSDDDWDYIANFELWSTHADGSTMKQRLNANPLPIFWSLTFSISIPTRFCSRAGTRLTLRTLAVCLNSRRNSRNCPAIFPV